MTEAQIRALVSLLDDTDDEVVNHVREKLLDNGGEALPILEGIYLEDRGPVIQGKISTVIDLIQQGALHRELGQWAKDGGKDLFEGFFLISKFRYPELNKQNLNNIIDKIKLDAWLELNFQLAASDKVRILNQVFYDQYGFKGNSENYHAPDNSFLNRVLETRKGNPISLAIVYSIVAQRLNIPIFGVNLPQHFVLAYKDDTLVRPSTTFNANIHMDYTTPGDVLFYINAFNKGSIFSKWNVSQFLKQLNLPAQDLYFEPCSNVDIIMRVCRNLIFSYEKLEDKKAEAVKEIVDLLMPYASLP